MKKLHTDHREFAVGTKFIPRRFRTPKECTIVDVLKTYNKDGDIVKIRYVATHEFCGQVVTDHDVCDATVAMGLVE